MLQETKTHTMGYYDSLASTLGLLRSLLSMSPQGVTFTVANCCPLSSWRGRGWEELQLWDRAQRTKAALASSCPLQPAGSRASPHGLTLLPPDKVPEHQN